MFAAAHSTSPAGGCRSNRAGCRPNPHASSTSLLLLINRQFARPARHPIWDQPVIPEMLAPCGVRDAVLRPNQRGQEYRAIGAAEIVGGIKLFLSQCANDVPMPPPRRTVRRQRKGPSFRQRRERVSETSAPTTAERVRQFPHWDNSSAVPESWNQMHRVAKKPQVNYNDLPGVLCALQKVGR